MTNGKNHCQTLPVFHSFTGSDTTSFFNGKGKKSAWQAWKSFSEITETFLSLVNQPYLLVDMESHQFKQLFSVVMYDKTCPLSFMNDARMTLFAQQNRSLEHLPPTQVLYDKY